MVLKRRRRLKSLVNCLRPIEIEKKKETCRVKEENGLEVT